MSTSFLLILVLLFSGGAILAAWAGIRSIQSARSVVFYRTRQARMLAGWQWLGFSVTLVLFAVGSAFLGKPFAGQFISPGTPPTVSPAWTLTISSTPSLASTLSPSQTSTAPASSSPTSTSLPQVASSATLSASWEGMLNGTRTALAVMTMQRNTFIAMLSFTPTASHTPIPTWTRTPSSTPRPTYTASPTRTPRPTWTASLTSTPVTPSLTRTPSSTHTRAPTRPTRTPSPTRTPRPTFTFTLTPSRTVSPTP